MEHFLEGGKLKQKEMFVLYVILIGAELGGAAGARAPPLLHNPRKCIL